MKMWMWYRTGFDLGLCLLILSACKEQTQETKQVPSPSATAPVPAQVAAEYASAYQPGPNPMTALYGNAYSKSPQDRFASIVHHPPQDPMPTAWQGSFLKLEKMGIQAKLSEWSTTERTRLDQTRTDYDVRWVLHMMGTRRQVKDGLSKVLAPVAPFSSIRPKTLADELTHEGTTGAYRLSIKTSIRWQEQEKIYLKAELNWSRHAPLAKGKTRNCRYVKGLNPPSERQRVPWISDIFSTNDKRRFAEWSYQMGNVQAPRWTGLWVYRNGSLRDQGVRWWSDVLVAHGGKQIEMKGMEQNWKLPDGQEIQWWSESNPNELGCILEAPLLAVSWFN